MAGTRCFLVVNNAQPLIQCVRLQALDVTAEPDGKPPQRVEYRPGAGRSALAAAWPAIVGVGLAALLGGFAALHCLRRRSKRAARLYDALLERCTRCRPSRRTGWAMQVVFFSLLSFCKGT